MDFRIQADGVIAGIDGAAFGTMSFDTGVHPLAAVTRTCYALADIATFEIRSDGNIMAVRMFPISGVPIEVVAERFRLSLVDFTLREDIEARTRGMRDLIWQTAFGEVRKRGEP